MKTLGTFVCFALVTLMAATVANAGALWSLQSATFDDGTTASGTFVYDAVGDTYSEWDLVVEAASFMPAYNYLPGVDGGFVGSYDATRADFVAFPVPPPPSGRYLRLVFDSPLTDAGGIVNLTLGGASWDCANADPARFFVSGSVSGVTQTVVPEPATFGLLGIGLVAVGVIRRRRNRAV